MRAVYDDDEDEKIVQFLIDNNADVNATRSDDCSTIIIAVEKENLSLVKMLVEAGADIDVQCSYDNTSPLMQAAYDGNEEIVAYLKEQGADLDLVDTSADTALAIARYRNYENIVEILREK